MILIMLPKEEEEISAHADGGPRSHVCSRNTSVQPPIDMSGNFPAHVSAELPSTISPDYLELISKVSENKKNVNKNRKMAPSCDIYL